jgi:heme oxygenase
VRYLGDLNGGRVMKQLLERSLGLEPAQLAFYDFPLIPDMREFRTAYRAALDHAVQGLPEIQSILDEAAAAFRLNVEVSDAVHAAVVRHAMLPHA